MYLVRALPPDSLSRIYYTGGNIIISIDCWFSSDNIENDDYLLTKISRNCRFKIEDINISVTDSDISIY